MIETWDSQPASRSRMVMVLRLHAEPDVQSIDVLAFMMVPFLLPECATVVLP